MKRPPFFSHLNVIVPSVQDVFLFFFDGNRADDTETDMVVFIGRGVFIMLVGGAGDNSIAAPPTAFLRLARAGFWPGGVGDGFRRVFRAYPIADPFHHIAGEVVCADPTHAVLVAPDGFCI